MEFTGEKNERHIEFEWDEEADGIKWRQKTRKALNVAIRRFNQWNEDGLPEAQWGVVKAWVEAAEREYSENGRRLGYDDPFSNMYAFLKAHKPKDD